jgi:hypothetical protein
MEEVVILTKQEAIDILKLLRGVENKLQKFVNERETVLRRLKGLENQG